MNKLLVICGPTATGKTELGLRLANLLRGEILSADSRQVYKRMDIGTGKDIPDDAIFQIEPSLGVGYYTIGSSAIWGYDLVDPKETFSIAEYQRVGRKIINYLWKKGTLPIVVGGSGLYIKALIDNIETIAVPRNEKLRSSLSKKTSHELFDTLAYIDPLKAASMNKSDKHNPRRLIRAIEIGLSQQKKTKTTGFKSDSFFVGLTSDIDNIRNLIKKRVDTRTIDGIENEIEELLGTGVNWNMQSMQTLGYREWRAFFEGKQTKDEVVEAWINEESKYVKRQMTWFRKDKRINWFNIEERDWQIELEERVKIWYNNR
jgi:tRNA dimethylallyltransferase